MSAEPPPRHAPVRSFSVGDAAAVLELDEIGDFLAEQVGGVPGDPDVGTPLDPGRLRLVTDPDQRSQGHGPHLGALELFGVQQTAAFDRPELQRRTDDAHSQGWLFDIYVEDMHRAQAFYETVLGTELSPMDDRNDPTAQMRAFGDDFMQRTDEL